MAAPEPKDRRAHPGFVGRCAPRSSRRHDRRCLRVASFAAARGVGTREAQSAAIAHRLRHPTDESVTVMTVIALSSGTMTVDVDRDSTTIHVHSFRLADVAAAHHALEGSSRRRRGHHHRERAR